MSADQPDFITLQVAHKAQLATDITGFDLRAPDDAELPPFTPGAHVTLELPGGVRRNYSLCGDPADREVYELAVKREAAGRGGSIAVVDALAPGSLVSVSLPRNDFELRPGASEYLFIAGGIGITPILSMMRHLIGEGRTHFNLVYCTRDAPATAFLDELRGSAFAAVADRIRIHHDGGDPARAFDFWPLLEKPGKAQVYCCGPAPLMDAVADMSGHWPGGSVRFERFGVDAASALENARFEVWLDRTCATVQVEVGQSILEALRAAGIPASSSCESGTCGTCRTTLISGEVDHRDSVLFDDERESQIMICVSRAKSGRLVLDL